MRNVDIAKAFLLLSQLMDFHGDNQYKIRSYENAYKVLRREQDPLKEMPEKQMLAIPGIGEAIVKKIIEINQTGKLSLLDNYVENTPDGIIELLSIRGIGTKKILAAYNQLNVQSVDDLLKACSSGTLATLKGFGKKTVQDITDKIEFYRAHTGYKKLAFVEDTVSKIKHIINTSFSEVAAIVGSAAKNDQILKGIDVLIIEGYVLEFRAALNVQNDQIDGVPICITEVSEDEFAITQLDMNSSSSFIEYLQNEFDYSPEDFLGLQDERAIFDELEVPYIAPPQRELFNHTHDLKLIEENDIKGLIHCHSTYSDGLNSIEEMAEECRRLGLEYMVITDHSKSAFYANGLSIPRVHQQWKEIDKLNSKYTDFFIFKGIESDILANGDLDYPDEILNGFDVVIGSIHSGLNMDQTKATNRILKALENPYMSILGHPSGRLILERAGYDLDYNELIGACKDKNVVIELNAHPSRLDINYTWLPLMKTKNVLTSINPDAHSRSAISMIRYGVVEARKASLTSKENLSSLSLEEFREWVDEQKQKRYKGVN